MQTPSNTHSCIQNHSKSSEATTPFYIPEGSDYSQGSPLQPPELSSEASAPSPYSNDASSGSATMAKSYSSSDATLINQFRTMALSMGIDSSLVDQFIGKISSTGFGQTGTSNGPNQQFSNGNAQGTPALSAGDSPMNWQEALAFDGTREGLTQHEFRQYMKHKHGDHIQKSESDELFFDISKGHGKIYQSHMDAFSGGGSQPVPAAQTRSGGGNSDPLPSQTPVPASTPDPDPDPVASSDPTPPPTSQTQYTPSSTASSEDGDIAIGTVDGTQYKVGSKSKSPWHITNLPRGTVEMQYETLKLKESGVSVPTDGADYVVLIRSDGAKHKPITDIRRSFGLTDDFDLNSVVGLVGSADKGGVLVKADSIDTLNFRKNSAQGPSITHENR